MLQPLQTSTANPAAPSTTLEARLDELVALSGREGDRVTAAMRYALLGGGKRLRPRMLISTAVSLGAEREPALDPACAVEMVHVASLVLDDLPSMDDAALRRGRTACHRRHGVATATLAAVALLNRAYHVLSSAPGIEGTIRLRLVRSLSRAVSDCGGMVAGQEKDLRATPDAVEVEDLRTLASQKTGALFTCAVDMGARLGGADDRTARALRRFARSFGLAFQILDDLADLEGRRDELGKDVRQDADKATFATHLGPVTARRLAREVAGESLATLGSLGLEGSELGGVARRLHEAAGRVGSELEPC